MKKIILTLSFIAAGTAATYAQKYFTRTAKVSFNATAANSPEKIEAVNNQVACAIDASSGDVAFQVLVKSFTFERSLMQEHFNENYMESDKLPKADFKGKIVNLTDINFAKDGTYNIKVAGKLTIHGVTNDVTVPGSITVKGNNANAKARFSVKLADYKINVPTVVADKVGKDAAIILDADLSKK